MLAASKELGEAGGDGTNPEQLFVGGYSACFLGAPHIVFPYADAPRGNLDVALTVAQPA